MRADFRWSKIIAFVLMSTLAAPAVSGPVLIDDFNDGNDDGWTRGDMTEDTSYGPALLDVNGKGEYRFASGGIVPGWAPYGGAIFSTWNGSTDPQYSDGFVRARMRVGDTHLLAGLLMRLSRKPDAPPSGYMFRITTRDWQPELFIERLEGGAVAEERAEPFTLHVDEDLMIEAGAVGDHLTLKVWPADEVEPSTPQLEWTDSTFTTGLIGLEANVEGYSTLFNRVDLVFDDVYFTPSSDATNAAVNDVLVPEPTGVVGIILGGTCLVILARRHHWKDHAFQSPVPYISARNVRTATVAGCALLALVVFSAAARGQTAVFDLGSFLVDNDPAARKLPLPIPAGPYNAYRLTTDWSNAGGNAWSREALWTVADGPLGDPATHYYANPGKAPNSAGDNSSVQLVWEGLLDIPLSGPRDVSLIAVETYLNSRARWRNTVLELSYEIPPTAPALDADLGIIAHEFDPLSIVTTGDLDTELAVYSSTGAVLAKNDDAAGPTVNSELRFDFGLPSGNYIAVVGSFNTNFANEYTVTPGGSSGNYGLDLAGNSISGTLAAGQVSYIGFSVRILGDVNGDNLVDVTDIDDLSAAIRSDSNDPSFDLNGDKMVSADDSQMLVKDILGTWFGDANLDHEFNSGDMVEVFQNGKYELDVDAGWAQGDWTADERFDSGDLVAAFQDGGYESGPRAAVSTVPEPCAGASWLFAWLAVNLRRSTKTRMARGTMR